MRQVGVVRRRGEAPPWTGEGMGEGMGEERSDGGGRWEV